MKHVETDVIVEDVGMWDRVEEFYHWWVVGVALWELHFDMEHTSLVESPLWASNVGMPYEEIILQWASCDSHCWELLLLDLLQILGEALMGKGLQLLVDCRTHQCFVHCSSLALHKYLRSYKLVRIFDHGLCILKFFVQHYRNSHKSL